MLLTCRTRDAEEMSGCGPSPGRQVPPANGHDADRQNATPREPRSKRPPHPPTPSTNGERGSPHIARAQPRPATLPQAHGPCRPPATDARRPTRHRARYDGRSVRRRDQVRHAGLRADRRRVEPLSARLQQRPAPDVLRGVASVVCKRRSALANLGCKFQTRSGKSRPDARMSSRHVFPRAAD
jgi:hypothetical protein